MFIPKIEVTYDYDKFKFIECNRPLNPKHIQFIKTSITEYDISSYSEIKVTTNYGILDGQHRFMALRELQKPIFYMVVPGTEEQYQLMMIRWNNYQRVWSPKQYFHHYLALKVPDFLEASEFLEYHQVPFNILYVMISRDTPSTQKFRKGTLDIKLLNHPYMTVLIKIVKYLKKIKLRPAQILSKGTFFLAILEFCEHRSVDISDFCEQLQKFPNLIKYNTSVLGYIRCFVEIYNYNRKIERICLITNSRRGAETYELTNLVNTKPSKNINLISFDGEPIKQKEKTKANSSQYSFV